MRSIIYGRVNISIVLSFVEIFDITNIILVYEVVSVQRTMISFVRLFTVKSAKWENIEQMLITDCLNNTLLVGARWSWRLFGVRIIMFELLLQEKSHFSKLFMVEQKITEGSWIY